MLGLKLEEKGRYKGEEAENYFVQG